MLGFSKSLLVAAAVAGMTGVAVADTWDNPLVANPIVNNGITIDGTLGDWGVAGTNYTQFGEWNQWYDGSHNPAGTPKNAEGPNSQTYSRMAIDTANNRLILGVQTSDPAASFEIQGLFGGTSSLEGQNVKRRGYVSNQVYPNTGTQLYFELPTFTPGTPVAPTAMTYTEPDSTATPTPIGPSWAPGAMGGYQVLEAGVWQPDGLDNPDNWAKIHGMTGAYSFDGTWAYAEVSIPVKLDWLSEDFSAANTYNLNDLAGLVGGTGDGNLNIAYAMSMFARNQGWVGDSQNARFDGLTGTYGNSNGDIDYWEYRAVNSLGVGPNADVFGGQGHLGHASMGGLTLVGTPLPEPGSLALLAAGGVLMLKRRRLA